MAGTNEPFIAAVKTQQHNVQHKDWQQYCLLLCLLLRPLVMVLLLLLHCSCTATHWSICRSWLLPLGCAPSAWLTFASWLTRPSAGVLDQAPPLVADPHSSSSSSSSTSCQAGCASSGTLAGCWGVPSDCCLIIWLSVVEGFFVDDADVMVSLADS